MIELCVLGGLDLRGSEGEAVVPILAQPRRAALLAYLAVATPRGFHRRDKLLGLFWPERDSKHARGALRNALYFLRQSLGEGVVVSRGAEEVGLAADVVLCDAVAFEVALEEGRTEEALNLYRGDLLEGFLLSEAPEFERWLDLERERLRGRAAEAAWTLVEREEAGGNGVEAARWARRAVSFTPTNEVAFRRLLELLDRLGDRTGAIQEYEAFARRWQRDYGSELSPETQGLIASIREREAPVAGEYRDRHVEGRVGEALRSPEVGGTMAAKRLTARRRKMVAATVAGFVLLVLAVGAVLQNVDRSVFLFRPAAADFVSQEDCIVVAQFENETERPHFGLAVRTLVVTDIGQTPYVYVLGDERLRGTLELMRLPDTTRLDPHLALEIARRENCPAVVSGAVAPLGTGYSVTAAILETETGAVVAPLGETAADSTEIMSAVERLARLVRRHLGESLASIRRSEPLERVTTSSLEALELYSEADGPLWARADWAGAILRLERAVELDTTFATAYRRLGTAYTVARRGGGEPGRPHLLAWRFREHATERERLLIEAHFYMGRRWWDSTALYYEMGLERYPQPDYWSASLANFYYFVDRFEDALAMWLKVLETPRRLGYEWKYALDMAMGARALNRHGLADSALAIMRETIPPHMQGELIVTAAWNAYYAGDLGLVDSLAREMENDSRPTLARNGQRLRYGLAALHGRMDEALAALAAVDEPFVPGREAELGIYHIPIALFAADTPERALPYLDGARSRIPETELGMPFRHYRYLGRIALGYALARDTQSARELLAVQDSLVELEERSLENGLFNPIGLREYVRAVIALQEGRAEDAVQYFSQAKAADSGRLRWDRRALLADAHAALGNFDQAIAQYDTLTGTYRLNDRDKFWSFPLCPLAHERLGSLYLEVGDTVSAARHLGEFIELWKDADPELQPRVDAARRLLEQLSAEEAG
jgi:serine/threonine-protein kinase